ncbi:MAG: ABC transporter ATP-binding protein [Gracilibacteraceae bacterium]|jgi:ABC-2 type transport system ATP-binding protein|nr:ABC transporter ATP-binding protein [Gracilibacteraceae bacterium]
MSNAVFSLHPVLTAKGLSKRYGGKLALDNFQITALGGRIIGLLGPNGSGKTTFLKIAAGLVKASGGEILLDGRPPGSRTKADVAFMSTEEYLYAALRIKTIIGFFTDMFSDFDRERCFHYLPLFNLTAEMKVRDLSTGMRAGLKLILVFSRRAAVVLLDEPLNGIDVVIRDLVLNLIKKERREDRVIFVTSHLVDDLETVIDEAVFLDHGRIVLSGSMAELTAESSRSLEDVYREVYRGKID